MSGFRCLVSASSLAAEGNSFIGKATEVSYELHGIGCQVSGFSAAWPRASSLIDKETLALCFTRRGGVYPRPKTTAITATGGDKPRPYFISM